MKRARTRRGVGAKRERDLIRDSIWKLNIMYTKFSGNTTDRHTERQPSRDGDKGVGYILCKQFYINRHQKSMTLDLPKIIDGKRPPLHNPHPRVVG
jgi:hypothetical protein